MKAGSFVLEFLVYLVISFIVLSGAITFMVQVVMVNKKLEHTILATAAVHNVISLLRQDAARMPCQRQAYTQLTEHDFSCTVTSTTEVIRWYVDDNSLKRASRVDGAWDYSVVLEPINQCLFTYKVDATYVRAITVNLSHNGASCTHTLWLRSFHANPNQ